MEAPGWSAPYFNDDIATFRLNNLFESDALLLDVPADEPEGW